MTARLNLSAASKFHAVLIIRYMYNKLADGRFADVAGGWKVGIPTSWRLYHPQKNCCSRYLPRLLRRCEYFSFVQASFPYVSAVAYEVTPYVAETIRKQTKRSRQKLNSYGSL